MVAATTVVLLITGLAPVLGPHLAGVLSPFPVCGAVVAIFTHHSHGPTGAHRSLGAGLGEREPWGSHESGVPLAYYSYR